MKLTFQERSVAEMSAAAFEQARRIDRMETLLRSMAEKLKELAGDGAPLPQGERPPHY
jgi:uncharacterized coiled-coil protein SlyX